MRVIVYVEGPSDVAAMEGLLRPLIERKQQAGVQINFTYVPKGDGKKAVLIEVPQRAASIVANDPDAWVVAMPDLYPRNKGFPHETAEELLSGIYAEFEKWLQKRGIKEDERVKGRFKAFCFKYDLEALILAAEEALAARLGVTRLAHQWKIPVEDQDQDEPPKRIVEALFSKHGDVYEATSDAPLILSNANYQEIKERCPQLFKPFVEFLESF